MNKMQGFYASLSTSDKIQDNHFKILAKITKIDIEKIKILKSDLGWQEWEQQNQKTTTA